MRYPLYLFLLLTALSARAQLPACGVSLATTPITCAGGTDAALTVVTNSGGPYLYSWSHDAGATGAAVTNLGPGFYSAFVTGDSCLSVLEMEIVDPDSLIMGTFSIVDMTCAGTDNATLTLTLGSDGPYTFTWAHDPPETNTTLTDLAPAAFSVTIVNSAGCEFVLDTAIYNPGVFIGGTVDYCPSDPPLLVAIGTSSFQPNVFVWSTGDSTTSVQMPAGSMGIIDLTATDTTTGCVNTAQVFLTELPSPLVGFSAPDTTCQNVATLVHTLFSTADSLVWRWEGTGFSNELDPHVLFTQDGWGQVSLQGYDSLGCGNLPVQDSIFAQWQVPAIITVEQIPCTPMVEVVLGSPSDSCALFVGDSIFTHECGGTIRYDMRRYQEYTYTLYATQPNGCNDTTEIVVDVRTEPTLFLANAFTPNGDLINDLWPVRVNVSDADFRIRLFDRWGMLIWETTDPADQWDGNFNGSPAPLDVYAYTFRMRDPCEPSKEVTGNGFLTVIR
jgi:large repetitive protein